MRQFKMLLMLTLMAFTVSVVSPALADDLPQIHKYEQLAPDRPGIDLVAVDVVQVELRAHQGKEFLFSQSIPIQMADEKTEAGKVATPPPAGKKDKYSVIGLTADESGAIPIRFGGQNFDLAKLSDVEAEFLLKHKCPYLVKG